MLTYYLFAVAGIDNESASTYKSSSSSQLGKSSFFNVKSYNPVESHDNFATLSIPQADTDDIFPKCYSSNDNDFTVQNGNQRPVSIVSFPDVPFPDKTLL